MNIPIATGTLHHLAILSDQGSPWLWIAALSAMALLCLIALRRTPRSTSVELALPVEPVWNPTDEELTTRLLDAIPELTSELDLSVVSAPKDEFFQADDSRKFWFIPLGTNRVDLCAKATFRYHVPLRTAWRVVREGNRCVVVCPELRATLPVAFNTAGVEVHTKRGALRFPSGVRKLTDTLVRSLTQQLGDRAQDPGRIALVRETARASVQEFAIRVLAWTKDWQADRLTSVQVCFGDEPTPQLLPDPVHRRAIRDWEHGHPLVSSCAVRRHPQRGAPANALHDCGGN